MGCLKKFKSHHQNSNSSNYTSTSFDKKNKRTCNEFTHQHESYPILLELLHSLILSLALKCVFVVLWIGRVLPTRLSCTHSPPPAHS